MEKIESLKNNVIKYFGDIIHNDFWLEKNNSSQIIKNNDNHEKIKKIFNNIPNDGVICIYSEELSEKYLCKTIAEAARDIGNRIYILVNEYNSELANLEGCLIRYKGNKRIGSFILINPNTTAPSGCVFTGALSDESMKLNDNLLLDIDQKQIETLFGYFCYQFWNNKEGRENIGKEERNTEMSPVDIYPPVNDSCDFDYLCKKWNKTNENAFITTSRLTKTYYTDFSGIYNSDIITLLEGADLELLRLLKQQNNKIIAYNKNTFINFIKTQEGAWLIPKINNMFENNIYSIKLNPQQEDIINAHINAITQGKNEYEYYNEKKREELKEKFILHFGETNKIKINSTSIKYIKEPLKQDKFITKDELNKLRPPSASMEDDGKSIHITYSWEVIPFALPKESKKHELYNKWQKEEEKINSFIDKIIDKISEISKRENKLIAIFLSDKKKILSEYKGELIKLKEVEYCYIKEPKEIVEIIKRINELAKIVDKNSSEIKEKNRQAEIEEQIANKEKEKENYNETLNIKKDKLTEIEKEINELGDNKKMMEQKNNEKKNINGEIKKIEIKIQEINNNINNEKEKLKKVSQNTGEAANVLSSDLTLKYIPVIGERKKDILFQCNGQNYLAIEYWEEYEEGKAEADRLGAKLCAKGE